MIRHSSAAMSNEMLAAVLHGAKDLRVERRPVGEVTPGKVLLRLRRAGICGSDIHYFEEGKCAGFVPTGPFVLGHEVTGEVVAIGQGVDQVRFGQRVVVNPASQCGECDYCRSGRGNLCRRGGMLGSASTRPPTDGGFCEYLVVPAEQCFALPSRMDDGLAAMMEPFAVALHALKRGGSVAGKRILVAGGGPIGLLVVIASRACGATTIALSDPLPERRRVALDLEADAALDPVEPSLHSQISDLVGDGFDIAFEASGVPAAFGQAFEALRRGGTLVQIGTAPLVDIPFALNQLMVREIQVVGSFRYGNVWEEAIRLVAAGRVDLQPLISRVFPLQRAAEALSLAGSRNGVLKVQLDLCTNAGAAKA